MNIRKLPIKTLTQRIIDRLVMQPFVQRILVLFGHELNPQRWVFIIGCYNSGTTLLASMLRYHPQIGGLPTEGAYLSDVLPYPEKYNWPRMWAQCIQKMHINLDAIAPSKAMRIKKQWSIWFPKNKQILIEKSISNATRIKFLNKYFEPAYFIYIVRNGYAVAKGIQKKANLKRWNNKYKASEYPIELCAEQWKISDELVDADLHGTKHIKILYEDFMEEPKMTLKKITDFLEINEIPDELVFKDWVVHEVVSPIANMNPKSFKKLSISDCKIITSIAKSTLDKYGYTEQEVLKYVDNL